MIRKILSLLIVLISTSFTAQAFSQDKLVFALDLIRHGDRTPIKEMPKSTHVWAQGLGELTAEGMNQEYQLGVSKRREYVEKYHLLPKQYQSNAIYIRSSDINRTLMSAESFMLGLYPLGTGPKLSGSELFALPQGFQPIPINTIPTEQDNLMLPGEYGDAREKRAALYKRYVFSTQAWHDKNAALQSHYPAWSQATGFTINDLSDLEHVSDNLLINQIHHVAYPAGISNEDAQAIIDAGHWAMVQEFRPPELGDFLAHDLVVVIVDYLKHASEQNTPLKYVLFSGHDSTILGLMSALRVPLDQAPHYASNVNFKLFKNEQHEYYVTITYNGKPIVLPACGSEKCSLPQLMKLTTKT